MRIRPWRRKREHKTKRGDTYYLAPAPRTELTEDGPRECWFPAALSPDECVFDRQLRCIRADHDHGDEGC